MSAVQAPAEVHQPEASARDRTRQALDFAHDLLLRPAVTTADLPDLLAGLARAYDGRGAGLAALVAGVPVLKERAPAGGAAPRWPWEDHADFLADEPHGPRTFGGPAGSVLAAAADRDGDLRWLVWLEADAGRTWTDGEHSALKLAAELLPRTLAVEVDATPWTQTLEQKRWQRRLEELAGVTGRLAHDFGNVLTGVLGFTELALTQLAPGATAHRHLSEVQQAARQGAQMIQKLSFFSRRRPLPQRSVPLRAVLAEEKVRVQRSWAPGVVLDLDVAEPLPDVALDIESLRQVVGQLLDNAYEAIRAEGRVTLRARRVDLAADECPGLIGSPAPGPAVELTVSDTGAGISPEVRRRLLTEVFVTSKAGHRGLGLAVVYGILKTYGGGFRMGPGPDGGTTARVFLPPAAARRPAGRRRPSEPEAPYRSEPYGENRADP